MLCHGAIGSITTVIHSHNRINPNKMKNKPTEKKIKDNFNLFRSLLIISFPFSKFTLNLLKNERNLIKNTSERIRIIIPTGTIPIKIVNAKPNSNSANTKE